MISITIFGAAMLINVIAFVFNKEDSRWLNAATILFMVFMAFRIQWDNLP